MTKKNKNMYALSFLTYKVPAVIFDGRLIMHLRTLRQYLLHGFIFLNRKYKIKYKNYLCSNFDILTINLFFLKNQSLNIPQLFRFFLTQKLKYIRYFFFVYNSFILRFFFNRTLQFYLNSDFKYILNCFF